MLGHFFAIVWAATNNGAAGLLASGLLAIAGGLCVSYIQAIVMRSRNGDGNQRLDRSRRELMRAESSVYRWFEPIVDEIKTIRIVEWFAEINNVQQSLAIAGRPHWAPVEFVAVGILKYLIWSVAIALAFCPFMTASRSAVLAGLFWLSLITWHPRCLKRQAKRRLGEIKRRLPYVVDLLALMLQSGASLHEALLAVIQECDKHPLGDELSIVMRRMQCGQTLRDAMADLEDRLEDGDINEMVFAVQKAHELGTPLAKIFKSLANQMRLKRIQWAETQIGKAQAMITFPGLIVMFGCILIVVAPFVLRALDEQNLF